jgi:hypothetical protein
MIRVPESVTNPPLPYCSISLTKLIAMIFSLQKQKLKKEISVIKNSPPSFQIAPQKIYRA